MAYRTVTLVLASAVATGGTFTVGYPTGTTRGDYVRGVAHKMVALQNTYVAPTNFTVSTGATSATVTYQGATTLPAGTTVFFQFDTSGPASYRETAGDIAYPQRVTVASLVTIDLGAPIANDSDGLITTVAITSAAPVTVFTGALHASGLVSLDVPRNIVAAWTGTAVMTVTGTDEYGAAMVESSGSGTSMTGVKAFKTVTRVAVSANTTSATVGTGNVLGLPLRLLNAANILVQYQDNAAAVAGTTVAALAQGTKSTATTASVRGTYTPNATPNGTIAFALLVAVDDPSDRGNPQFAG